ncbi:MAG: FeoA family protein [Polaromonas sp.]|nr:FeoA family protein [Polaromonas sp.]
MTAVPVPSAAPDSAYLADLAPNCPALVAGLADAPGQDAHPGVLQRLAELGFTAGETVCVLQRGPGGREPIAVQVGDTVFALRRHEARCVLLQPGAAS